MSNGTQCCTEQFRWICLLIRDLFTSAESRRSPFLSCGISGHKTPIVSAAKVLNTLTTGSAISRCFIMQLIIMSCVLFSCSARRNKDTHFTFFNYCRAYIKDEQSCTRLGGLMLGNHSLVVLSQNLFLPNRLWYSHICAAKGTLNSN